MSVSKQDVVLNVRSAQAAYIMYWHKMCIELSVLMSSGIIAVSTFGVDKNALSDASTTVLVAGFVLATASVVWLIAKISSNVQKHRSVLVKVDEYDKLFDIGAYLPADSLYPASWREDDMRMDIIPKWSIGLVAATCLTVSVLMWI